VRADLEDVVALLKKSNSGAATRRKLLRQLRNLLQEADRLLSEPLD
jgi:hypothetical protein